MVPSCSEPSVAPPSPRLLTTLTPPAMIPSGSIAGGLRAAIKQPKVRRIKPSSRLESLSKYVATSGCYDVIDAMLQAVLVERPTAVLPFLVQFARGCEHKEKRAKVATKLEQGKVLSVDEMELLRGPAPEPVLDEAFVLLEVLDPIDLKLQSGHLLNTAEVLQLRNATHTLHLHTSAPPRICTIAPLHPPTSAPPLPCAHAPLYLCARAYVQVDILARRAEGAHGAAGLRQLWADYLSSQQVILHCMVHCTVHCIVRCVVHRASCVRTSGIIQCIAQSSAR